MASIRIILLTIALAVLYGLVHNQITIRLSYEYFTIAHPRWIESQDPTVLALFWGVVATWWAGAIGGVVLALACRVGPYPKLCAADLRRPLGIGLLLMGASAFGAALLGAVALPASVGEALFPPNVLEAVPKAHQRGLLAAGAAHNASYLVGAIVVGVVGVRCWRRRTSAAGLGAGRGAMDA